MHPVRSRVTIMVESRAVGDLRFLNDARRNGFYVPADELHRLVSLKVKQTGTTANARAAAMIQ
jgi:hypothetical protein